MPSGVYVKTEEHKKKISDALMGHKMSPENKAKIIFINTGRKHTLEARRKMSIAKQNMTEETKKKMSIAQKGKKRGPLPLEHRKKISEGNKGPKNWRWKGGVTPERLLRLNGMAWDVVRRQVYKRDGFACQKCGTKQKKLNCHHIVPYRISADNSPDNLITLCASCHNKEEHGYYKRLGQMELFNSETCGKIGI